MKEPHNKLARVEVAGGLSRQVGEEEVEVQAKLLEEVQGGEVEGLLLLDVEEEEGEEGLQIRQVAEEEVRLEGEEGGGSRPKTGALRSTTTWTSPRSFPGAPLQSGTSALARR